MGRYWKEFCLVVCGQVTCAAVGLGMFGAQAARELERTPPGPTADATDSAELRQRLVLVGVVTLAWMSVFQALTVYLMTARARESLQRRDEQSEHRALRQTHELVRARDAIIFALAKLADSRDPETGDHLERITAYSKLLADAARNHPRFAGQITPEFIRLIHLSAALHDIGKVGIEDDILRKRGPLTADERERMQRHAQLAADCLDGIVCRVGNSPLLTMAREIAIHHHERWDGSGYPHGLAGERIPLAARIVAIADVYDALSSPRVYKDPWPHERCVAHIRESAGTHFDPELVEVWSEVADRFSEIARRYVRLEPQAPEGPSSDGSVSPDAPRLSPTRDDGRVLQLTRERSSSGVA